MLLDFCCLEILKYLVVIVESVVDILDCIFFNRVYLNCEMSVCV